MWLGRKSGSFVLIGCIFYQTIKEILRGTNTFLGHVSVNFLNLTVLNSIITFSSMSVCLFICLSVCLSVSKKKKN